MRKPIPGYSRYEVDDTGRVFNTSTGREITESTTTGYKQVSLMSDKNVRTRCYVHRLVAQVFIPNEKGLPIINHKDENPLNNCASNLEWCSHKYNSNYGHCKEKRLAAIKAFNESDIGKEFQAKQIIRKQKAVIQYDRSGKIIAWFKSIEEASVATNSNRTSIGQCCSGKRNSAGGYLWAYGKE